MSLMSNYLFNNADRIGMDVTDETQRTLQNTRFSNYTISNYNNESLSDSHVKFATNQPAISFNAVNGGSGVGANVVDFESLLHLKNEQERSLEKIQLIQRPFLTVPYLGRGSCDPVLESQLLQGEIVSDKKSTSTVMDKSFMNYSLYPTDSKMEERVKNTAFTVEESALNGWVRGGASARNIPATKFDKNQRPSDSSY
jgi:hypothetical protein